MLQPKIYKNSQKLHYIFYKDRFLLSLSISIITHALIALLVFIFHPKEEKTQLRPLSLGVLKQSATNDIEVSNTESTKEVIKDATKTKQKTTTLNKKSPIFKKNTKEKIISKKTQEINTDFDLNKIKIDQDFNPFKRPVPSITQTLNNLSSIDGLPEAIQDSIKKLYGDAYDTLSKDEKEYIAKSYVLNAEVFQRQADRVGYPPIAARFKQTGQPIIEFTLFPDGHIEDIKYIKKSGFYSIDDSIKHIIEIAAKDLLRPPKPIKIRIQGNYF